MNRLTDFFFAIEPYVFQSRIGSNRALWFGERLGRLQGGIQENSADLCLFCSGACDRLV